MFKTSKWSRLYDAEHKTCLQQSMQMAAIRTTLDRINTTHNLLQVKFSKAVADYENMVQLKEKVTNEYNTKVNILKLKEDENNKFRLENGKLLKSREVLMKKMMQVETNKSALEQEVIKLKNIIVTFEKERDSSKKAFDMAKKQVDGVLRERDLVRKDLMKANKIIAEHIEQTTLLEKQQKTMENEIKGHLAAAQKQLTLMSKIEKERDRNAEEAQQLTEKVEHITEDMVHKQNYIIELREKLHQVQTKMTQVQTLFETARTERNIFERDLQCCIEDRNNIKENLKTSTLQVEQLNEDIAIKEAELFKAQKSIDRIEKEKQSLRTEIQTVVITLQHTKSELNEKNVENNRLYKTLADDEVNMMRLRKQLDGTINEKDLLKTQLTQRMDEINNLTEKLNMLNMALDRGESQYRNRLDDIRLLKIEISNLRSQRNLLTRGLANTADMRQEVLQLNRILTQERVKAKALEDEMLTPMNVHRWRKLAGKDPEKIDLMVKVHSLQRRVLCQTITVAEKEKNLEESQKVYDSLKDIMKKLPHHNVKEKLNITQRALTARTRKLKALSAEIRIKEIESKDSECTVEELKKSLLETKKQLLKERKEKIKLFDKEKNRRSSEFILLTSHSATGYRMVGSGYKVPC